MKKHCFLWILTLLLAVSLCTPALAATDYGMIYDETDELGSPSLTYQGEELLPELSETLGIDLRVDVLTMIGYDTIEETAAGIYARYGYGYGPDMEGVTLTLLMELQDSGSYAMSADNGWCVYAQLGEGRGSSEELAQVVREAVAPSMAERAWNGEDLTMSATALSQAVYDMVDAASDYILTNCPPDFTAGTTPDTDETPDIPETPETPETPDLPETPDSSETADAPEADSVRMEYIFDLSDLLSYKEWQELEARAKTFTERHHCGIYLVLVDDYTEYGDEGVYLTTAQLYYHSGLGYGEGRDGIIVLLSMAERDYAMFVCGTYAEYAFNEYGQEELEGYFLGDFGRDDWADGISHYLDACHEFLTKAEAGEPVRESIWPTAVLMLGLSCVVAGVVCFLFLRRMKTVRPKSKADVYITAGGLHLTAQRDQYERTVTTRTKIQKESSSGSGSTRSESGGGGSGRSGKF